MPIYTAIDSAGSPTAKAGVGRRPARIPAMVNFLSDRLGPYPFELVGLVADWVPDVGYALENQTKPHFAGDKDGPTVPAARPSPTSSPTSGWATTISPANWSVIWFNEGWATFAEVLFDHEVEGADMSPQEFFRAVYDSKPKFWKLAPASSTATRPSSSTASPSTTAPGRCCRACGRSSATTRFFDFARDLNDRHGGGNISRGQFVSEAKRASGFRGRKLQRLGDYFRQWLLWDRRPHLTPPTSIALSDGRTVALPTQPEEDTEMTAKADFDAAELVDRSRGRRRSPRCT